MDMVVRSDSDKLNSEEALERHYDVTVAGHICLDIIPHIPDTGIREISELFKPGKLIQVNAAKISTGGPVSNTGIALKKLGLKVAFMSRVGKDQFGELILSLLSQQGQISGISVSSTDRTSYTIVIAPPGIDRIFLHDPGANDRFSSADLDIELIRHSRLFHFGYPPIMAKCYENEGEELVTIFQRAKSAGATTSLDMALPDPTSPSGKAPWRTILTRLLPHVDMFMPSIEEVFFMLDPKTYLEVKQRAGTRDVVDFIDPDHYRRLASECLALGSKMVFIKTGHRGSYILTKELDRPQDFGAAPPEDRANWSQRELWCPAFRVEKIASATGSGDSAIAGFLAAYLRGYSIEKTLRYANCVGYQNLHELDAVSGIKDWQQTTAMVQSGHLTPIELPLPASHWQWDQTFQLWIGPRDSKRTSNSSN